MIRGTLVAVAAFFALTTGAAFADTANVAIQSGAFVSDQVSVLAGDTVSWQNQSLQTHTVTARDGSFGSPHIGLSGSYSQAFPGAGTFAYYCQIHPFMTGEVDVYDVLLEPSGDSCTCKGHTYGGYCKHVDCCRALIGAGKL